MHLTVICLDVIYASTRRDGNIARISAEPYGNAYRTLATSKAYDRSTGASLLLREVRTGIMHKI